MGRRWDGGDLTKTVQGRNAGSRLRSVIRRKLRKIEDGTKVIRRKLVKGEILVIGRDDQTKAGSSRCIGSGMGLVIRRKMKKR